MINAGHAGRAHLMAIEALDSDTGIRAIFLESSLNKGLIL